MNNRKTAFIIIILVIVVSLLLYFLPVNKLIGNLPFLNRFYNNTSLEIITQKGKAKIWINGKEYGETPNTVENLPEGNYIIELEKITDNQGFYQKHSFPIQLTRNTSARIDFEIGPDNLIHGIILYYTAFKTSSSDGFLTVISNVDDAKVFLDKEFVKTTPITNLSLKENQYDIKIVTEGFEDIEIPLLIRNNYTLHLKTYQFPIPVTYEEIQNINE
jgi:hypothetical protein